MIFDNDIGIVFRAPAPGLEAPGRLDVAVGLVLRLRLHRVRYGDLHGYDALALNKYLAVATAAAISARARRRLATLGALGRPGGFGRLCVGRVYVHGDNLNGRFGLGLELGHR